MMEVNIGLERQRIDKAVKFIAKSGFATQKQVSQLLGLSKGDDYSGGRRFVSKMKKSNIFNLSKVLGERDKIVTLTQYGKEIAKSFDLKPSKSDYSFATYEHDKIVVELAVYFCRKGISVDSIFFERELYKKFNWSQNLFPDLLVAVDGRMSVFEVEITQKAHNRMFAKLNNYEDCIEAINNVFYLCGRESVRRAIEQGYIYRLPNYFKAGGLYWDNSKLNNFLDICTGLL